MSSMTKYGKSGIITMKNRIMLLHMVEKMLLVRVPQPSFMQQGRVFLTLYDGTR